MPSVATVMTPENKTKENRMCYIYKYICNIFFFFFKFIVSLSLRNRVSYVITRFVNELSYCFHHLPPILSFLSRSFLMLPYNNQIYYIIQFRSSSIVSRVSTRYDVQPAARWDVFFFLIRQFSNDCNQFYLFFFFKICCFCLYCFFIIIFKFISSRGFFWQKLFFKYHSLESCKRDRNDFVSCFSFLLLQ